MAFEFRVPAREEFAAFILPTMRAFGVPEPNEEELDDQTLMWEPDRSVGALDDGEWIGGTGAYSFDLTLPGRHHAAGRRRDHGRGQRHPPPARRPPPAHGAAARRRRRTR